MGQFKPMVKMMTDEPSVILKLKKGGKVHHKEHHEEHGHKSMHHASSGMMEGAHEAFEAEHGNAPKKPSMAERRRSMNPNQYAKGGKVAHKALGGMMPAVAPTGSTGGLNPAAMAAPAVMPNKSIMPMGRPALAQMPDAKRMARAAMLRKALTGMKKGGSTKDCAALEKELKHHEALSASKAHPQRKASGGAIDRDETRTTIESGAKKFDKTKMDTAHKDRVHGTGKVKEGKPGGYKMGGTIEGNEGKFAKTKVNDGDHKDRAHGTKGIKEGAPAGFKKGGSTDWENRPANDGDHFDPAHGTTGVRESNGGGYKKGGAAKKHFATGGNVVSDGKAVKMPRHFVSRPVANSLQSGTFKRGGKVEKEEAPSLRLLKTHTGPKGHVAKVYKDRDYGEHRVKFFSPEGKHMTDADYHTDDVSDAHDTAKGQLGRYKAGGKVNRYAEGDGVEDLSKGAYAKSIGPDEDDMKMARAIRNIPSRLYEGAKSLVGIKKDAGAGRGFVNPKAVTETEKSVTVEPRKRGGKA